MFRIFLMLRPWSACASILILMLHFEGLTKFWRTLRTDIPSNLWLDYRFMKKITCTAFFLLSCFALRAQYYYHDIISTRNLNSEYVTLKKAGLQKTVLESFEDDDSPSEGFFCEKKFSADFSSSTMISKSRITGESELKTSYADGRVVKTESATPTSSNTSYFNYEEGRLISVVMETVSSDAKTKFVEERLYEYDSAQLPVRMRRSKDGREVSVIRFVKDSSGHVIEEVAENKNTDRDYYYYYDAQGQLTDVVRYNPVARRLLPDYMFIYNAEGQISQMISVDESGRNYHIWRYSYRADGLPEIQKIYTKEKRLLGTIQFEYFK